MQCIQYYSRYKYDSRITVTLPEWIKEDFRGSDISSKMRISLQVSQHSNINTTVSSSLYTSTDRSASAEQAGYFRHG